MGCAGQVDLGVFGYAGSVANTILTFWRGWMSPKGHPALLAYLGTFSARETYLTDTYCDQGLLIGWWHSEGARYTTLNMAACPSETGPTT